MKFSIAYLGGLEKYKTVKESFEFCLFRKLRVYGYCSVYQFISKNELSKHILYDRLKNSPCLRNIFESKKTQPKNIYDLNVKMIPVIEEIESNGYAIDENGYIAIVYYILSAFGAARYKEDTINSLIKKWNVSSSAIKYDSKFKVIYDSNRVTLKNVKSINEYLKLLKSFGSTCFYRGHGQLSYELIPSLFRKSQWLKNEKKMHLELVSKCPEDFDKFNTHIGRLSKMQHYGLPTRLLDVTTNPLIALYFVCESESCEPGEVIAFHEDESEIKYFQSDTVSLLSSLSLFSFDEQKEMYKLSFDENNLTFNGSKIIEKLSREIKEDRNGFQNNINPEDLRKTIFCLPEKNSRRIINQDGAFIICGLLDEIYGNGQENILSKYRIKDDKGRLIIILVKNKKQILADLEMLGINKARIYPEVDDVADYVKNKYSNCEG